MRFRVDGKVRGKGRPRFWNGHAVTPQETRDYEELVAMMYRVSGGKTIDIPCRVKVEAHYKIPSAASRNAKADMLNGLVKCTRKPDIDNVQKIILDGLNGVAYKDDSQVYEISGSKVWDISEYVDVWIMTGDGEWK